MNNGESIRFRIHGFGKNLLIFSDLQKIPTRCKTGLIRVIDLKTEQHYYMRYENIIRKFR